MDKTKLAERLPELPEPQRLCIANATDFLFYTAEQMREYAARAVREAGWRPIAEAPTDVDPTTKCGPSVLVAEGTYVDLGFYHDGSHCYGHRGGAGWFVAEDWGDDRLLIASNINPTHWMPLPSPPDQEPTP